MNEINTGVIAASVAVIVQAVVVIRWLYRRARNDDVQRAFVKDMATNHLPHIYNALGKLCGSQGIELGDPPPIRWIDFNGNGKTK